MKTMAMYALLELVVALVVFEEIAHHALDPSWAKLPELLLAPKSPGDIPERRFSSLVVKILHRPNVVHPKDLVLSS